MPRDETLAPSIGVGVRARLPARPNAPAPAVAPRPRPNRARASRRELLALFLVVLLLGAAFVVARSGVVTSNSDAGYWIGVAGGSAMLLLFTYPIRKRWRRIRNLGPTRIWFALHMTLGIAGPALIIVHSTLQFGSLNAAIAFGAMALVAGSGVVGRFLYAKIHHGLYGRRVSLAELRAAAGLDSTAVNSKLAFAPDVERVLNDFAARAETTEYKGLVHPWRFLTLGVHAAIARRRCRVRTTRALRELAAREHWSSSKLEQLIHSRGKLIATHLRAVQRVAQFGIFERLFSIWHVLHVPLVYMLVLSAVAHVVAVHMY